MEFIPENINQYITNHSEDEPIILQNLNKETWQKVLMPRMLSGHFQGRVLSMIAKLIHPKNILEIGTYTGYSALCLAEGIQKDGILYTIDHNEELVDIQEKYFNQSVYGGQIKRHVGQALDIIPSLKVKFDLVFIDADKENYSNYFDMIIDKMNPGGIILSDNVLWSGKVTKNPNPKDIDTVALIAYNQLLKNDPRIETVILPIRDGLTLSRVKK